MKNNYRYVLITPARNEESSIEKTIKSVVSQTILPEKWIIVSDGSTDRTDEIVGKYAQTTTWMELIRMPEHTDRQFAAKVHCFNAGYAKITETEIEYDIIGNLDADISFEGNYFNFLLAKFAGDPALGVAGTPFVEDGKHYDYRFTNIEHVSGACQLFRRECFEEIGGYIPIKGGGIDWVAVTTARMKGWKTRTFTDMTCLHHRKIGTGDSGTLKVQFKYGQKNYCLGGHPLWHLFRSIFQMKNKPYVIGGILLLWGYVWAFVSRAKRPISAELMQFYRAEQTRRLHEIFRRAFEFKRDH
ncbi:MAG: glycosyltransferase family 2 protein [Syntrophobacterales bacterium]|nr:glycosyltransferase family 2 protein [Syntrophobacterales bacterium]